MSLKKKQNSGLKRDTTDKFYTDTNIAQSCIDYFEKYANPEKKDTIIEPSAGNGSFSNILNEKYDNVSAYDILPENENITKQDYLKLNTNDYKKNEKKIHIIGNPPFGRQSTLAKKFIKKSSEFADTISFILPKSFKKSSFQKSFPLEFHLIFSYDLPEKSFVINEEKYDVPCVFQIWQKQNNKREIEVKIEAPNFIEYVKKTNEPNVSIRRVGVYAGKINKNFENDSIQSHYFLKIKNIPVDEFVEKYKKNVNFSHDNTVGPKSLSIQELNKEIAKLF